jgi:hypothetical protein
MLRFWARMFHAHLIEEIAYLREQVNHERQRAELAIDELLRIRVGVSPVTQPTPAEAKVREENDPISRMLRDSEFMNTGELEPTE